MGFLNDLREQAIQDVIEEEAAWVEQQKRVEALRCAHAREEAQSLFTHLFAKDTGQISLDFTEEYRPDGRLGYLTFVVDGFHFQYVPLDGKAKERAPGLTGLAVRQKPGGHMYVTTDKPLRALANAYRDGDPE